MPNTVTQEIPSNDGDLTIETFDQMQNPSELWLNSSRVCLAVPADTVDPVSW